MQILFAQGNGVDDHIKDFSMASKFTSGIDHKHLGPIFICLQSQSASSSITPSITRFSCSTRFFDAKSFIPLRQTIRTAASDLLFK